MSGVASPIDRLQLAERVWAAWPGVAWLPQSATLVAADAHLGYEEVIGGALPLWSTAEAAALLASASRRLGAREIVFLGDVVHGPAMSEGAAHDVRVALDALRKEARVTLVAGNHEGRSRAFAVLGETERELERDGWLLIHGDGVPELLRPAIVGHLHPSVHLGGGMSAPAFVACERLVVLPALTPYSSGLDCRSDELANALGRWNVRVRDARVAVVSDDGLRDFGALGDVRTAQRSQSVARRRFARVRTRNA